MATRRNLSPPAVTPKAQSQHNSQQVTIRNLWNDREFYENFPKFQRDFVWPFKFKRALIDSILRGAPIPSLFAYKKIGEDGKTKYCMLDGHQRLSAVYSFLRGEFTTWTKAQAGHEEPNSLPPIEPGLHFHELSEQARNLFLDYQFTIALIDYVSESQLGMYYRRIQHHLPLKLGEILASYDSVAVILALQLQKHAIWETSFEEHSRKRNESLAGGIALLATQIKQGCVAVSSGALRRVASGLKDDFMTQELYDTVVNRLDVVMHVFDRTTFTHPTELVLMYQAVMFLENRFFTFTTSDKGRFTNWFGGIQAEAIQAGRRGYSYALGDRMRELTQQEDFWEAFLPELIELCKHPVVVNG